jgi:hypothetical protein
MFVYEKGSIPDTQDWPRLFSTSQATPDTERAYKWLFQEAAKFTRPGGPSFQSLACRTLHDFSKYQMSTVAIQDQDALKRELGVALQMERNVTASNEGLAYNSDTVIIVPNRAGPHLDIGRMVEKTLLTVNDGSFAKRFLAYADGILKHAPALGIETPKNLLDSTAIEIDRRRAVYGYGPLEALRAAA